MKSPLCDNVWPISAIFVFSSAEDIFDCLDESDLRSGLLVLRHDCSCIPFSLLDVYFVFFKFFLAGFLSM